MKSRYCVCLIGVGGSGIVDHGSCVKIMQDFIISSSGPYDEKCIILFLLVDINQTAKLIFCLNKKNLKSVT